MYLLYKTSVWNYYRLTRAHDFYLLVIIIKKIKLVLNINFKDLDFVYDWYSAKYFLKVPT